MLKTRSFSIFLLKEEFNSENSLKEKNNLCQNVQGSKLPEGSVVFVIDNDPYTPWWKDYFGLDKELEQVSNGALVFVPAAGRNFVLSFGHASHNLKDISYEYDFGLRITLNCVDPDKLKSTDILQPNGSKRQRTQSPSVSDITYFEVDNDSTILKSLTGKVKKEYRYLFSNATGASNIHISIKAEPNELVDRCKVLLDLYESNTYKIAFPNIQSISPVKDPTKIKPLNDKLMEAFNKKADGIALTVPEMLNYNNTFNSYFSGAGAGKTYEDICITNYYDYLQNSKLQLDTVNVDDFKKHYLTLTDEDEQESNLKFPIYKCLVFDTSLGDESSTYHLSDGSWYFVDENFINKLTSYLDPYCKDTTLPEYDHENEGDYNYKVSKTSGNYVCCDKTNIALKGQKQVEPCDIYEYSESKATLHHVKISTISSQLSHLFNQGTNSINLLMGEDESKVKFEKLICEIEGVDRGAAITEPLREKKVKIVFHIITSKESTFKSKNLPLFSRISLMRCLKDLKRMGIEAEFCFIKDNSEKKEGKIKVRKSKNKDLGSA